MTVDSEDGVLSVAGWTDTVVQTSHVAWTNMAVELSICMMDWKDE